MIIKVFLILLFFSVFTVSKAINNLKSSFENKIQRIKALNPTNISSLSDKNGGIYLFWKESKSTLESHVNFTHLNLNSESSEQNIGKRISNLSRVQNNPISIPYFLNDAIIAWKDYSNNFNGDIYLQRISSDRLLWGEGGIRVTKSSEQVLNFSLDSDNSGNIFVTYTARGEYPSNEYKILYQRILSDGSLSFKSNPMLIESSARSKNNLKVIHDDNGGAFILWIEKINDNSSILLKKVDPSGKSLLAKKPIMISGTLHNTINFCESFINKSLLYVAWETADKNIYHQLINNKGRAIWTVGGKKAAYSKGINTSPEVIQYDSVITLGWLNNFNRTHSLFIQRFKPNGKGIWEGIGVPVIKNTDDIVNYSLSADDVNGLYVTWMKKTLGQNECKIFVQRISDKGKLLWDSLGTESTSAVNCDKNYLSVFPGLNDLAIISYENPSGEIMIEKIPEFINPELDYLNLTSALSEKSVLLRMDTNVKDEKMIIIIERLAHSDTSANVWEYVGTVEPSYAINSSEYEFTEIPVEFGTLYYRAILKSDPKELLSNVSRIDYLEAESKIIVAQNNPNPFGDSTVISFYLPVSDFVAFEFFDEHAEKIAEFEEKEFPAGENSVTFYANDRIPGIYFYKLLTKNFVEVKKMVLN